MIDPLLIAIQASLAEEVEPETSTCPITNESTFVKISLASSDVFVAAEKPSVNKTYWVVAFGTV